MVTGSAIKVMKPMSQAPGPRIDPGMRSWPATATGKEMTPTSATARSHLIWWRSIDEPRRNRTTTAAHAPRNAGSAVSMDTVSAIGSQGASAGIPKGFSDVIVSLIGPGVKAGGRIDMTVPTIRSQPIGCQRGEGRCPSGKISGTPAATITIGGTQSTSVTQAVKAVNGHVPPAARLPSVYAPHSTPAASIDPATIRSHPTRFPETRMARKAPTPAIDAIARVKTRAVSRSIAPGG